MLASRLIDGGKRKVNKAAEVYHVSNIGVDADETAVHNPSESQIRNRNQVTQLVINYVSLFNKSGLLLKLCLCRVAPQRRTRNQYQLPVPVFQPVRLSTTGVHA